MVIAGVPTEGPANIIQPLMRNRDTTSGKKRVFVFTALRATMDLISFFIFSTKASANFPFFE